MLVAISGSQGSGKSVLINQFEQLGHKSITRKTSRSILADWNVTLDEVNNNHDLTIQFQNEILKRKIDDEREASLSSDVWFTERTPIDLLVYSTVTLGMNNKFSDWLDAYGKQCIIAANQLYSHVFFLTAGHFSVENDGVRGHNKYYSALVDATMSKFYHLYVSSARLHIITTPSLSERINTIKDSLRRIDDGQMYNGPIYNKSATEAWK